MESIANAREGTWQWCGDDFVLIIPFPSAILRGMWKRENDAYTHVHVQQNERNRRENAVVLGLKGIPSVCTRDAEFALVTETLCPARSLVQTFLEGVASGNGGFRISTGLIVERAWRDALGPSFFIWRLIFSLSLFSCLVTLSVPLSLFVSLPLSVVIRPTLRFYLLFPSTTVFSEPGTSSFNPLLLRGISNYAISMRNPPHPPCTFPTPISVSRVYNTVCLTAIIC